MPVEFLLPEKWPEQPLVVTLLLGQEQFTELRDDRHPLTNSQVTYWRIGPQFGDHGR